MKRPAFGCRMAVFVALAAWSGAFGATSAASPVQHTYNIRLATVHPYATRSRRGDTVYAQITVYVNKSLKGSIIWQGACDDNACPNRLMKTDSYNFGVGTAVDTGPVKDTDDVTWSYEIVNAGRPPSPDQFSAAATALASSACTDPWPCATASPGNVFATWDFTGCDGAVAVDSITRKGAFLASHVTNREWGFERRYTAASAPRGCAKSDYQVITIVRQTH